MQWVKNVKEPFMKSFFAAAFAVVAKLDYKGNHENTECPETIYPSRYAYIKYTEENTYPKESYPF